MCQTKNGPDCPRLPVLLRHATLQVNSNPGGTPQKEKNVPPYVVGLLTSQAKSGSALTDQVSPRQALFDRRRRQLVPTELHVKEVELLRRRGGGILQDRVPEGTEKPRIRPGQADVDVIAPPGDHDRRAVGVGHRVPSVVLLLPL